MSNRADCAAYFKAHREWESCFELMRKKWESYGRAGGRIVLQHATEAERKALEGFFGKTISGEKISYSLQEFEAALQRTKFAPLTLKELLDAYFEQELQTKQEKAEHQRKNRQRFFEGLKDYFEQKPENSQNTIFWLQCLTERKQYGYSALMAEWERSEKGAEALVKNVGDALVRMEQESIAAIPLAVLAAEVTGNPHYFDRGSTAGTLFMNALCCLTSCEYPQNAYDWREMLLQWGILPDEVSNTVIIYGLHLETEMGLHPAFEGFNKMQEPGILISQTLKNIKRAYGETGVIFVVENEMVFSYLTEHLQGKPVALLCTSGQPRTAAVKLLEMLAQERVKIFYSGDMDPEGIRIADRIWQSFPEAIHIWRMGREDYAKALSEEKISGRRLAMLDNILCPELYQVAQCLKAQGKAAYQENLIKDLLADIICGR